MRLFFISLIVLSLLFSGALITLATAGGDYISPLQDALKSPITDYKQIVDVDSSGGLLFTVIKFAYYLLFVVATLFIIIAAYNYVLGGGDKSGKKIQLAHSQIKYAVIALIVGLLILVIPQLVVNTLEGDYGSGGGSSTVVPPVTPECDQHYCSSHPYEPCCQMGP